MLIRTAAVHISSVAKLIRTAAVHISSVAMLIRTAAVHISSVAMLIRTSSVFKLHNYGRDQAGFWVSWENISFCWNQWDFQILNERISERDNNVFVFLLVDFSPGPRTSLTPRFQGPRAPYAFGGVSFLLSVEDLFFSFFLFLLACRFSPPGPASCRSMLQAPH